MGDSWEDDDFTPVVPVPVVLPSKAAWEDEDAVRCVLACMLHPNPPTNPPTHPSTHSIHPPTRQPEDPNAGKTPEEIAAEAEKRRKAAELRRAKADKDAEVAANQRASAEEVERMARETPEERALRERLAVERADQGLADELFGGPGAATSRPASSLSLSSTGSGLGGSKKTGGSSSALSLKSSGDYVSLAKDLGPKFKKTASSKDVATFVSDLLAKGAKDPLAVEDVNELIKNLQSLALEKQRQADANRNKIGAKQKAMAAQKKDHKQKSAKHKETFGAEFDDDDAEMDQYYDMEDVRILVVLCCVLWNGRWMGGRIFPSSRFSSISLHTVQEFM